MVLTPEEYASAAREATAHLQVVMAGAAAAGGIARVTGAVARVFTGQATLLGTTVTVAVPCDDPDDWAPDGLGRMPVEALHPGRVLEAIVQASPDGFEVVLDLCQVLDNPTDTPRVTIPGRGRP